MSFAIATKMRRTATALAFGAVSVPALAAAEVTTFKQGVAASASSHDALASFYREIGFEPIWTGVDDDDLARRAGLLAAIGNGALHGLPPMSVDADMIRQKMSDVRSERERAELEVELSKLFLEHARRAGSGVLVPSEVVPEIKREIVPGDAEALLQALAGPDPDRVFASLAPNTQQYARLVSEKARLESLIADGGWGDRIATDIVRPGDDGDDVIALRNRLVAMGYLARSAATRYDPTLQRAVERFQEDHGLEIDGIVGGSTLSELNRGAPERLGQILVAMERERWMNRDLGQRHIWVNLADFRTKVMVDGDVRFETRSVIGETPETHQTPEFSDEMDHMVVNPSWYVPHSIAVNEILPDLRSNPYSHDDLEITDRNGRVVDRSRGFSRYTADNFPYSLRQPPGPENSLGLVKFMFPNTYAIYLHDTPADSLFSEHSRAFSHGCIRLGEPFEFAHELLSVQSADPVGEFGRILDTGDETRVDLDDPVPVHLVYRTAIAKPEGGMEYRPDIYERDAPILSSLRAAGVVTPGGGS